MIRPRARLFLVALAATALIATPVTDADARGGGGKGGKGKGGGSSQSRGDYLDLLQHDDADEARDRFLDDAALEPLKRLRAAQRLE